MKTITRSWCILILLACQSAQAKSPNLLLILTDDQGWSQVSHQAHPGIPASKSNYLETPNMSRIAREGMMFTRGYSPAPLCTPTRRSILCGASAARSGTEFASNYVPADHLTIPRALKRADPNYMAAHFGKWGEKMISTPEECGYDVSDGMTGNVTGGMADKLKPYHLTRDPKRTESVTDRAIEFIRRQAESGNPFYAQVSYYATHLRVELNEDTLKKYQSKGEPDRAYTPGFAGMLEELDTAVGRMLDTLDELGLAGETYVVFTTDNGGRGVVPGGNKKSLPPNHPLKGAKHSLDEGGIRVPFYVRGPGIEPKTVNHTPVAGYDLLPTFYELAGGSKPLPAEVDGGSLVAILHGSAERGIQRGMDGLVFHRPKRLSSVLIRDEFKLMLKWDRAGQVSGAALYNTLADPTEQRNLAAGLSNKTEELKSSLLGFLESVNAEPVPR